MVKMFCILRYSKQIFLEYIPQNTILMKYSTLLTRKKYFKKFNTKISTDLGIRDTRLKNGLSYLNKIKICRLFVGYNS